MNQNIINWLLSGFGILVGFILKAVYDELKDLQATDKSITDKVAAIEVLVAGDYVKKDEFTSKIEALFTKLDKIEDKIDKKADKT